MTNFTFLMVPMKLGELAVHLARGDYPREALDLTRRVLSPAHVGREPNGARGRRNRLRPVSQCRVLSRCSMAKS